MKKSLLLMLLAVYTAIPAMTQTQDYQHLYQRKVVTYTKMKNAGWTMTGVGGGLLIAGGALLATLPEGYWGYDEYDSYYYEEPFSTEDDLQAMGGIICVCLGVGLMAGGITMGSIGSHKVKSYKQKLNNISLGIMSTPKAQGLTLTYRF